MDIIAGLGAIGLGQSIWGYNRDNWTFDTNMAQKAAYQRQTERKEWVWLYR